MVSKSLIQTLYIKEPCSPDMEEKGIKEEHYAFTLRLCKALMLIHNLYFYCLIRWTQTMYTRVALIRYGQDYNS